MPGQATSFAYLQVSEVAWIAIIARLSVALPTGSSYPRRGNYN